MTQVTINGKDYGIKYTMLAVVDAQQIVGQGFKFFETLATLTLAAAKAQGLTVKANIGADESMSAAVKMILVGLHCAGHGEDFKTVRDLASALPSIKSVNAIAPAVNAELVKFYEVDEELKRQLSDAIAARGGIEAPENGAKKKTRSKRSRKART